jgi:hypothetical protein
MNAEESYLRLVFWAAVAVVVAFVGGIQIGRGALDALKEWQTLIGALVASAAVYVAYINVSRQVRMNIILREEQIINDEYPGTMDAAHFLSILNLRLSQETNVAGLTEVLQDYRLRVQTSVVRNELEKVLPQTSLAIRSSIAGAIAGLNFGIDLHQEFSSPDDETSEEERQQHLANVGQQLRGAKATMERRRIFISARLNGLPAYRNCGTRLSDIWEVDQMSCGKKVLD